MFHLMLGITFIKKMIDQIILHAVTANQQPQNKSVLSCSVSSLTTKIVPSNIHPTTSKYYIQNATFKITRAQILVAVFIFTAKVLLFNTKSALYYHKQLTLVQKEVITPIHIVTIQTILILSMIRRFFFVAMK